MSSAISHAESGSADARRLHALLKEADSLVVVDAPRAETLLREARELAARLGAREQEALALTLLGASYYFRSQYLTALDTLSEAQEVAEQTQDGGVQARVANNLGICVVALGQYDVAIEHFQRSLDIAALHGDDTGRVRALSNMGLLHIDLGSHELALEVFQEVLMLTRRLDDPFGHSASSATINLVVALSHLGRVQEALELAHEHLPVVQALGIRQHEVVLRVWILPCLLQSGQATEAVRQAGELLPLALEVDDHEQLILLRMFHGQALLHLGDLAQAQVQLERALTEARQHGVRSHERTVLQHLSRLHAAREDWREAYVLLQAFGELDQALHAEAVERKAKVLGAQMQMEVLRREAEAERSRISELQEANSALEAAQEALAYRAAHDALTGLANRAHFHLEVERLLQAGVPELFAILFIDLDRFKQVNDTLGHDVGDELLRAVAGRLTRAVRSGDLVARMGGDEFTIILRHIRLTEDAERVAHKVLAALSSPVTVCGHTLHVTASIGVAVSPRDGLDVTTLQKHADIAMYRAKHEGKNGVRTFAAAASSVGPSQAGEQEKKEKLLPVSPQLPLRYLPRFGQGGSLEGFEVEMDGTEPGGTASAGSEALRERLRAACEQAVSWQALAPGLSLTVRLSAGAPEQPGPLSTVRAALEGSGLDPARLRIELVGGADLPGSAAEEEAKLGALGVQVVARAPGGESSAPPFTLMEDFQAPVTPGEAQQSLFELMRALSRPGPVATAGDAFLAPRPLSAEEIMAFLLGEQGTAVPG